MCPIKTEFDFRCPMGPKGSEEKTAYSETKHRTPAWWTYDLMKAARMLDARRTGPFGVTWRLLGEDYVPVNLFVKFDCLDTDEHNLK